jgi:hypothetical protein
VHKAWLLIRPNQILDRSWLRPASWAAGLLLTQFWVLILWLFFRIQDFQIAINMIGRMFHLAPAGTNELRGGSWLMLWLMALPIVIDTFVGCLFVRNSQRVHIGKLRLGFALGVVASIIVVALAMQVRPFIYFQF